jgi:hypothetical protein
MEEIQKFIQRNSRRILAIFILFAAVMTMLIVSGSGPTGDAWVAIKAIPVGAKVTNADIALLKVNLTTDSGHYLTGSDVAVGRFLRRSVTAGELIAQGNLSPVPIDTTLQYLPVGIATNDLPNDLAVSDLVNIYVIPRDQGTVPALIAMHISVQSIDSKSRNLGGTVALSLATNSSVANLIIDAESQGRLVLARAPF